jgi:hypothetical protein
VKLVPTANIHSVYNITVSGLSGIALNLLRNKRNIELDLRQDAARDAFLRVAATCDVMVTNLRPGPLGRLRRRRHQRHGGLLEGAARLAGARVFHDHAVQRVLRVPRDAGQLEGLGISPARVPVVRDQVRGPIGDQLVEQLPRRQRQRVCRDGSCVPPKPFPTGP